MKEILIITNALGGIYNFRKELVEKLISKGYNVHIVTPQSKHFDYFNNIGCKLYKVQIKRRGKNPLKDLSLLVRYLKIMKRIQPNIVLTYTIKPNIYGGLAATIYRIPYLTTITGLGSIFQNEGIGSKIATILYRRGLKKSRCVIFQNKHNKNYMNKNKIVQGPIMLVPGSGVNLSEFTLEDYPMDDRYRFLFIGRIMKEKGINEFLDAAKQIKLKYPSTEFTIIGSMEDDYREQIQDYENLGIVNYKGSQNNVHSHIKNSHVVINPSHHEGMSNVLLEAASTGRPVLASNISGCQETFDEGISGYGFEPNDVNSMVRTIIRFIELPHLDKIKMGLDGRRKMEKEFDRNIVVKKYLDVIECILKEG